MIVIDCGAYVGNSIKTLKEKYSGSEFYAFEPIEKYYTEIENNFPAVTLIRKAVWIRNEERDFFLGRGQGSSLYSSKRTDGINEANFITVECIDFSAWLKENFDKSQYIVLKLDIEGAEYKVLDRMFKDGTISYIDVLYCEFHQRKIDSISENFHSRIISKLDSINIEVKGWR